MTDANYARIDQLTAWAQARDHTMAELAHTWLLAQPQVCSVISGATKVAHVRANIKSADWQLSEADLAEANAILEDGD